LSRLAFILTRCDARNRAATAACVVDFNGFVFTHLDFLLWVEFIAIGGIGLFLVCLPSHAAHVPCRKCGYELEGLEDTNPTCPECGLAFAARKLKPMKCGACGARSLMDPEKPRCSCTIGQRW
jgi:ribosomal protein S27AE